MKAFDNTQRAVILYGPPGAGKGTQAELLSRRFDFVHFDTGRYIERLLQGSDVARDPQLQAEKEKFDSGVLNTPAWVLDIITHATTRIAESGMNIVFSGSPRTPFEAFGDDTHQGLLALLSSLFGKDHISILFLDIPPEESLARNSSRVVCSICGLPILAASGASICALCGGAPRTRTLDDPEVIKVRLQEFKERTFPIIDRMKEAGYDVHTINGIGAPYEVFERVTSTLYPNL